MKRNLISAALFASLYFAASASAQIVDAPHNLSMGMDCTTCHANPYTLVYSDDICLSCHNNATGGGYSRTSAPKVLTHSSANTSTKYGNWSFQCIDCHSKHTYEQRASYQSGIFLVTGTITSITDNGDGTTTFGYSNLLGSPLMPGWTDYTKWNRKSPANYSGGNERGLVLYPNTTTYQAQSAMSFEVSAATPTAIIAKGSINAAFPSSTLAAGSPFALAYGDFVNNSILVTTATTSYYKPVAFFESSGYNSFAYSTAIPPSTTDPTVNSVCQACHTQTQHWRNNGTLADHNNAQNCTVCHKHEDGFKASCGGCHQAPPATGAHATHFNAGTAEYGTTTVQSVANAYGFNCGICHNGTHFNTTANPRTVEVNFAGIAVQNGAAAALYTAGAYSVDDPGSGYTFNYSNGSCSSIYCHGAYPGSGRNATPAFNTGSAACGSCHNASNSMPPASGSHVKHAGAAQYNLSCTLCHAGEISGAGPASYAVADKQKHVNGVVDWAFDTRDTRVAASSSYGVASGSSAPSDGLTPRPYGACSTTYCHSNGTSVVTLNLTANASPVWGSGSLSCNSCHGAPPAYPNGSPKANSHPAHANNGCNTCHYTTTTDGVTITNFTNHANKNYDVNPNLASGVTFTYTFGANGGTCSNISCHGNASAVWGTSATCQSCHVGAADADDFSGSFASNGITSKIKGSGEWDTTGHGRPAASGAYASGNPPADLTTANACLYCHDDSVTHNTGSNLFRLKGTTSPIWGMNGVCQSCHAAGSAGVTVDAVLRNGAKKIGATHYGSKHNVTLNGGQFCWDCHDPHGDANAYMIHNAVAATSDPSSGAPLTQVATVFTLSAPPTGTDYARSSAPYNGICNVCHTTTGHYTSTSGDGHNATIRCTQCHSHTTGFLPNGDSCSDCHSSAGGPAAGTVPDAYHAKHVKTAYVGRLSSGDYGNYATNQWYRYSNVGGSPDVGCGYCHPQSSATHMNGSVNLNFDPADAGAAGTLKAKNSATQSFTQNTRVSVTCSSVYCHSDGHLNGSAYGYAATPNWYGGAFTGDQCAACHGNSPTGTPAHAAHVVGIHYADIFTGTSGTAPAGNTATSSHGYVDVNGTELTATTINCNVCHNSTVTAAANDNNTLCATCHTGANLKGVMTIAAGSTTHINGTVDVVFAATPVRSRAQIRDSLASVPDLNASWTRMNGYKGTGSYDVSKMTPTYTAGNCTVSCHNGNPITWSSTVTCNSCHTNLP